MGWLSKYAIPLAATTIIHVLLIGALFAGWEAQSQPKRVVAPNYIEAKLVKLKNQSKKKASAKKRPKKIDLTAKRKEQQRLKREAEAKRQATIKKEKAKAAKIAADKKKKEETELAKRQLAEQKKKAQEQRLQQEFDRALEEEQGMLMEEEYAIEAGSYADRIRQRVESSWSRPPSARTGMRCELAIHLVPTGRIVSVNVVEGSGSAAFDRSAVQAVKKVEIFPEVKDMDPEVFERYFRNFKFLFDPQDLRL